MQDQAAEQKTEADLKRDQADCRRCEKWRDELSRESTSSSSALTLA